jgi:hypothetical protein
MYERFCIGSFMETTLVINQKGGSFIIIQKQPFPFFICAGWKSSSGEKKGGDKFLFISSYSSLKVLGEKIGYR